MIKNIKFSNFHSFFEEVEISFEVSKKPASSMYDINISDATRLNKVVAIIGANGSGKTQLIKPLAFLSWFISDSFLGVNQMLIFHFKHTCCTKTLIVVLNLYF